MRESPTSLEQNNWKIKIENFDKQGVFYDLMFKISENEVLNSFLNQEITRLQSSENTKNTQLYTYKGFEIYFPLTEGNLQPGNNVNLILADLNTKQRLEFAVDSDYGHFLNVKHNNKTDWWSHTVKFDVTFSMLEEFNIVKDTYGDTDIYKEKLMRFIDDSIHVAQEQDIGLDIKEVAPLVINEGKWDGKYPPPKELITMGFKRGVHTYPRFSENLNESDIEEQLLSFYKQGKSKWGDAFVINQFSFEAMERKSKFSKLQEIGRPEHIWGQKINW